MSNEYIVSHRVYSPVTHAIVIITFKVDTKEMQERINREVRACEYDDEAYVILQHYKEKYEQ